ncbi:molybdenum cofactor guanylyltransferase MobA [Curvivirga sp.]|uniref:molybdenum cofactor guanylyltransferase MobA n=1 Tax=Curvivirga sp. TaxID=2856848 RepID=UPI003B5CEF07
MHKGPIVAVVLAGGLARRMNGEIKPLKELAGKPILSHIIDRITSQVDQVVINVNQNEDLFVRYGLPITKDSIDGFVGPLGGILAGMDWVARNVPETRYMISVPGDGPFLPLDLVEGLLLPLRENKAQLSVAVSNGRTQPVVGAWDISLREDLRTALLEEKLYKVDRWTSRYRIDEVDFSQPDYDPFYNTNKIEDLAEAETLFMQKIKPRNR